MKNKITSFFNALFIKPHQFGLINKIEKAVSRMNLTEKVVFGAAAVVCIVSGLVLLIRVHDSFLVEVPAVGGSFTEGEVGSPRFINPVLAISETDKDLSALIYSGLLKSSENGGFQNDMAENYEISEDGTVYKFKIRGDAYFHDGKEVTADDVIFTVNKILDPVVKSPKASAWEGVLVEKTGPKELTFTLKKPYAPFLQALTLGILPKHIWESVSSEEFPFSGFNIDPVGSGPYKVSKISRNSGGIPTSVTLSSWKKYPQGRAKISNITFKFFQNENDLVKAYGNKEIESAAGLSPLAARRLADQNNKIDETLLPRVFGVFFNQNVAPVLVNKEVRQALDMTAPKARIVNEVLSGFGKPLDGPTPANTLESTANEEQNLETAKELLAKAGWKENADGILEKKTKSGTTALAFSISTSDAPELKRTAEILKEAWQKLGAQVEIKVFEAGDLSQNVIKPRKYDALLFGEVVSENSDLYPFWHSSERNDPGLNISLYANITADKALSAMQTASSEEDKTAQKQIVFAEIKKDVPAVFLFSPDFLYAPSPEVKNISLKNVSSQNERFIGISNWYIETNKVLSIFQKI